MLDICKSIKERKILIIKHSAWTLVLYFSPILWRKIIFACVILRVRQSYWKRYVWGLLPVHFIYLYNPYPMIFTKLKLRLVYYPSPLSAQSSHVANLIESQTFSLHLDSLKSKHCLTYTFGIYQYMHLNISTDGFNLL